MLQDFEIVEIAEPKDAGTRQDAWAWLDRPATAVLLLLVVLAVGVLGKVLAARPLTSQAPATSTWEVFAHAGDQARAWGDAPAARRAYLTALFRARGERSVRGVMRAAEGFQALGDTEVVEQALSIAVALGPDDGRQGERLEAFRDRLHATDALPLAVTARP